MILFDLAKQKAKLSARSNQSRKRFLSFGLFLILAFLFAVYMGPFDGPEKFGLLFQKKQEEQPVQAQECTNSQATVSWPTTPGCLVSNTISWPSVGYKVSIYLPESLDPDRDGFSTDLENYIGTNPNNKCSLPPDFNGNGAVSAPDIFDVMGKFGNASAIPRYDLNRDGSVSAPDIFLVMGYFGADCSQSAPIYFRTAISSSTTYTTSGSFITPNTDYNWIVCYPSCSAQNYQQSGSSRSSSNTLTFSYSGIIYEVAALDKACGTFCAAPNTPVQVQGLSTTLTNLYPNRLHTYVVCYPTCASGTQVATGEFTSPTCTGSGANYSVKLTILNSQTPIGSEILNLTNSSYTFGSLTSNTQYNYYVYNPSGDHARIYKTGTVTSTTVTCGLTEQEMQNMIHFKINVARVLNGLPVLNINNTMVQAARIRSREIAQLWSHQRPDGRPGDTVLTDLGLSGFYGEILGRNNYPDLQAVDAVWNGWMESDGHRSIILGPYTIPNWEPAEMGAGVYKGPDGFKYFAVEFRTL